jgi:hypothetical protein
MNDVALEAFQRAARLVKPFRPYDGYRTDTSFTIRVRCFHHRPVSAVIGDRECVMRLIGNLCACSTTAFTSLAKTAVSLSRLTLAARTIAPP